MERTIIKTHFQLRRYLRKKDLRNLDLSKLKLSKYPESTWYDCQFENTDVHNTNININLEQVAKKEINPYYFAPSIQDCDFSGNDLHKQTLTIGKINIRGANLRDTSLLLDYHHNNFIAYYFQGTRFPNHQDIDLQSVTYSAIDESTLKENPHLTVSSVHILRSISETIPKNYYPLTEEEITNHLDYCLQMLSYDKQGNLKKIYESMLKNLTPREQLSFFQKHLHHQTFENLTLDQGMCALLKLISISDCQFINPCFAMTYQELITSPYAGNLFYDNHIINSQFPKINPSSWQEVKHDFNSSLSERIGSTDYTFRTSVYVELSRACPAHCVFCRNNSYDYCQYDLSSITESLTKLKPHVHDIVIGGGEPTLKLDDAIALKDQIDRSNITIFTNGMVSTKTASEILQEGFNINLSRHATSDEENAQIFGVDKDKILSSQELTALDTTQITLCPTLFQGSLDTPEKIVNYIRFAFDHNIAKILFQTLHKDASLGNQGLDYPVNPIDDSILETVKQYLLSIGYQESIPIYSTGGYKLTIYTHPTNDINNQEITISFKEYIPEKELTTSWLNATKKTFDLSIDPSGNIYENWNQKSNPVLTLKDTNHKN